MSAPVRLFRRSYVCILAANFLLFFGFWLLIPVLPFYLQEQFGCAEATIGAILSCYTISALCVRPFSGALLDTFPRRPLYLLAYLVFTLLFAGYIVAGTLLVFVALRMAHGLAFGTVTVGGNTLVVDIMPAQRRGEGLGYYGLTNNLAMSLGPMVGLLLHGVVSFDVIFCISLAACMAGLLFASQARPPQKRPAAVEESAPHASAAPLAPSARNDCGNRKNFCGVNRDYRREKREDRRETSAFERVLQRKLDRFILLRGLPAGFALMLLSIPYGATTNFVAMYVEQIGLPVEPGYFFTLLACGMGVSRLFAGKYVDKGYVTECIHYGFYLVILAFMLLGACPWVAERAAAAAVAAFFAVPLLQGVGFGIMFPAYNSLYINLARRDQRATATSTYLTSWDLGIGLGMVLSGLIAECFSFSAVYLTGGVLCMIAMAFFDYIVTPHYHHYVVSGRRS